MGSNNDRYFDTFHRRIVTITIKTIVMIFEIRFRVGRVRFPWASEVEVKIENI